MSSPDSRSNRRRLLRRIVVGGAALAIVVIWIASYFRTFGVAYGRKGDFDQRIASRTRGINRVHGTFICYSQWADPPDPLDNAILTINNQMLTVTDGFSAGISPADPPNLYNAVPSNVVLGFSHASGESNAPTDRYGTHFGISRWQFPIALVALPLCLLFAAMLRRTLQRRSTAARGFAVVVEGQNRE